MSFSPAARLVIAGFAGLVGVCVAVLWALSGETFTKENLAILGICFLVSAACLAKGRLAQFFGSLLAASIVCGTLGPPLLSFFTTSKDPLSEVASPFSWSDALGMAAFLISVNGMCIAYLWRARFGLILEPAKKNSLGRTQA